MLRDVMLVAAFNISAIVQNWNEENSNEISDESN